MKTRYVLVLALVLGAALWSCNNASRKPVDYTARRVPPAQPAPVTSQPPASPATQQPLAARSSEHASRVSEGLTVVPEQDARSSRDVGTVGHALPPSGRLRLSQVVVLDRPQSSTPPAGGPTDASGPLGHERMTSARNKTLGGCAWGGPQAVQQEVLDVTVGDASGSRAPAGVRDRGGHWSPVADGSRPQAPGVALPSPGEELWVIQRASGEQRPPAGENVPGCGELRAKLPGHTKEIPLPLKHTDVQAAIAGYIATVEVTQQYHNPYDTKIEAVYVFPLPENAAVNEFLMTVGERRIRGIIRERQEAEKIYQEAKAQGYVASLLTQERPNIFTQSVANIEPGKQIDINIKYFNTLAYDDGWYEFVFPMVVGPRFNPPGSTDGVGAVARGQPGISGQKTEVQYLKPGERSGHDIALAVTIDAGVPIERIDSRNHVIEVSRPVPHQAQVRLGRLDTVPNKDFVLRYQVAGATIKSAVLTHRDQHGGFFTMMIYPPKELASLKRQPMEMIFVLDCSGSMNGQPIAQVKKAAERALRQLQPDDTFQLIQFSIRASQLGPTPVLATPDNVRGGLEYLHSLEGEGGTMMIEGIKAALDFPHDDRRLRVVAFMTDGYIGNEIQILGEIHQRLGATRIFSFGVGSSPNRYLLDGMARIGRGAVAYVGLNDSAADAMDRFFERVSHPAMTDVSIDWGGMQVEDAYPSRVADLFVGRPVIVTGRFNGTGSTAVRVQGQAAGHPQEIGIPVNLDDAAATHAGLPAVWARMKIAELANRSTYEPAEELAGQIKQVALEYGLMSAYTAFVAVDSLTQTAGGYGTTVGVPVSVPDGVRYETTVQER